MFQRRSTAVFSFKGDVIVKFCPSFVAQNEKMLLILVLLIRRPDIVGSEGLFDHPMTLIVTISTDHKVQRSDTTKSQNQSIHRLGEVARSRIEAELVSKHQRRRAHS